MNIMLEGRKVGEFNLDTKIFETKRKLEHIYKNLQAFCFSKSVLEKVPDWKKIIIKTNHTIFEIERTDFEALNKYLNLFISFGTDVQIAIPLKMFSEKDIDTEIEKRSQMTVIDFVEKIVFQNDAYKAWKNRLKKEYYMK